MQIAHETFCLDADESFSNAALALQGESLTINTVRLVSVKETQPLEKQLSKYHNKKAVVCKTKQKAMDLHRTGGTGRSTIMISIQANDVCCRRQ